MPVTTPAIKVNSVKNYGGKIILKGDTFDEAYDALAWAKKQGYERLVIVTNAFHSRRAHFAFAKVFEGSGVAVEIGAAPDPGFSQANWWLVDSGLAAYLTEPLKFMAYLVFDRSPKFIENR